MARSILLEAFKSIDKACSSGCLDEECKKLATLLEEAKKYLPETGAFGLKILISMITGFLESMIDTAMRKKCGKEAILLQEAIARLKAFQ